ncbi:hypothetical protein KSP40_PGU003740 [Platanthera guangdongensis]|uniref:Uncharacterized protein n=1 Tax=Platanthera guangdongensis TaxID=2320717 RepID=A0ABR2LEU2_9ASPA
MPLAKNSYTFPRQSPRRKLYLLKSASFNSPSPQSLTSTLASTAPPLSRPQVLLCHSFFAQHHDHSYSVAAIPKLIPVGSSSIVVAISRPQSQKAILAYNSVPDEWARQGKTQLNSTIPADMKRFLSWMACLRITKEKWIQTMKAKPLPVQLEHN